MTSVTLTFDLWPWPFAWTLPWSVVITPENFMMIRWWEHSQKGVTDRQSDGQTDRQTENTIHRAAWSQLKINYTTHGAYSKKTPYYNTNTNKSFNEMQQKVNHWIYIYIFCGWFKVIKALRWMMLYGQCFNSLRPGNVIRWHRSGSTFVQLMACWDNGDLASVRSIKNTRGWFYKRYTNHKLVEWAKNIHLCI